MPHTNTSGRRRPAAAALLILLLACIGLTACGGSSSNTSTSATANAASTGGSTGGSTGSSTGTSSTGTTSTGSTATTPGAPPARPDSARFAALRTCLQKNGVTLPQRTPGSGRPAGGPGFAGGAGATLPKGVTRAQYEAALKKCGAGTGRFGRNGGARFSSPVFKQALTKYGECLRQNGVNIPAPNTSGKGPIFDTKGVNTSSPQFRAATLKCRSTLAGAFRRPGGGGPPSGGGA